VRILQLSSALITTAFRMIYVFHWIQYISQSNPSHSYAISLAIITNVLLDSALTTISSANTFKLHLISPENLIVINVFVKQNNEKSIKRTFFVFHSNILCIQYNCFQYNQIIPQLKHRRQCLLNARRNSAYLQGCVFQ